MIFNWNIKPFYKKTQDVSWDRLCFSPKVVLLSLPNNFWRLIVFAPFLLLLIKSPKQSLGDLLFLLRFLLLSLPNNVWRLIVFAPFLIIKSPKQSLGDLLFLLRFLLLFLFLLFLFFLSAKHELVHGRSQELQDRISWNWVEL